MGERHQHRWQRWELLTHLDRQGDISIRARATDRAGHAQPEVAVWNRHGYGNNAIQDVCVSVSA